MWSTMIYKVCKGEESTDYLIYEVLNFDEIELIYPNTFISDHRDQCKPWCAEQRNGGQGWRIGRFGYVSLMNSYGNPGEIRYFEAKRYEYDFTYIKTGFAIWIMEIRGYTTEERTDEYYLDSNGEVRNVKEYESMKVGPFPWAIFQFGINPIAIGQRIVGYNPSKTSDKIWLKYNFIQFPVVKIHFVTIQAEVTEIGHWAFNFDFRIESSTP